MRTARCSLNRIVREEPAARHPLGFGYVPTKVALLAWCAWRDRERGTWPDTGVDQRNQYTIGGIKGHLASFLTKFFGQSQFKRSCLPNGPKVGSGGALSPRGAPSDGDATPWLEALALVPDSE